MPSKHAAVKINAPAGSEPDGHGDSLSSEGDFVLRCCGMVNPGTCQRGKTSGANGKANESAFHPELLTLHYRFAPPIAPRRINLRHLNFFFNRENSLLLEKIPCYAFGNSLFSCVGNSAGSH
jgi:hypothetical protein